jgi:hypothetical protein
MGVGPGEDDVFSDDITVPATDGYPLAATLFLPRGAKRHAGFETSPGSPNWSFRRIRGPKNGRHN